jgi:hypothetical protein
VKPEQKVQEKVDMGNKPAVCKRMFRAEQEGYLTFNIDNANGVAQIEDSKVLSVITGK